MEMLRNLRIGRRLSQALAAILLVLICSVVVGVWNQTNILALDLR